ncbi:HmuY family protein [Echinicola sp. 20G]|uniref:HmuY family protein n=1 Tax=Echinicola sp. 20G TaxID=2781961 RepID=UPI001F1CA697|nr:HmuY family protein [Echinicola sp. 20G]
MIINNMKKVNYFILAMLALPLFTACTDNDETEPEVELEAVLVEDLYAPGAQSGGTEFVYYSLENNAVVDSEDGDWDLGFFGTTIIVNNGVSGDGNAEAAVLDGLIFDELESVPTTAEFAVDTEEGNAIPTGSGNGWYFYDQTTHIITPLAGVVILVKTNAGNYAKLEMISYYEGNPAHEDIDPFAGGYQTFRYTLQSNGTMNF